MTDALSTPQRPPVQGAGSDMESWRKYASHVTGRPIEGDLEKIQRRDELIALVDQAVTPETEKEAPEGLEVQEADEDGRPPRIDGPNGPQWAVPVKGGYVAEDDLRVAEREAEAERQQKRHQDRLAQLQEQREV